MLWAGLSLGPVLMVVSIGTSTALFGAKSQWVWIGTSIPFSSALDVLEWLLVIAGLMGLYKWVPYTQVRWSHAFVSALLATFVLQAVKQLLTWYMSQVPSVSVLYGTFSVLPVLFIWTFFAWLVVLWGGVVAAYLPSMMSGVHRVPQGAGWDFRVALEILQALVSLPGEPGSARAMSLEAMSERLQLDLLQIEPAYEALVDVGWVAALDEEEERVALLIDPSQQIVAPLVQRLLVTRDASSEVFWDRMPWQRQRLTEVLNTPSNGL
jgi:membrane protein